ncbi:hypothetical protein RCL_jg13498.t1 [Rhizophagus clarus]|uniref:Uncharacterized protein n=1 Tax=Rhizophagus clarus TaxID=94130 RepID=A0A8H3QSN5_9GLOM|nr:hypothetical protein RCL_jg13498.t1 [Rhizophagus clarus]
MRENLRRNYSAQLLVLHTHFRQTHNPLHYLSRDRNICAVPRATSPTPQAFSPSLTIFEGKFWTRLTRQDFGEPH